MLPVLSVLLVKTCRACDARWSVPPLQETAGRVALFVHGQVGLVPPPQHYARPAVKMPASCMGLALWSLGQQRRQTFTWVSLKSTVNARRRSGRIRRALVLCPEDSPGKSVSAETKTSRGAGQHIPREGAVSTKVLGWEGSWGFVFVLDKKFVLIKDDLFSMSELL